MQESMDCWSSGESEELLNLLPALKRFSIKIISFTGNVKSSLAKHSDLALGVKVEIQDRRGKGKIVLKYGSLEDFDRIVEALGQK